MPATHASRRVGRVGGKSGGPGSRAPCPQCAFDLRRGAISRRLIGDLSGATTNQDESARRAEIRIVVELDDKKNPVGIRWEASDAAQAGLHTAEAVMISIWDPEKRNTLSIDLWTSQMTVAEMDFFALEALIKMARTYRKATRNDQVADLLDGFADTLMKELEKRAAQAPKD